MIGIVPIMALTSPWFHPGFEQPKMRFRAGPEGDQEEQWERPRLRPLKDLGAMPPPVASACALCCRGRSIAACMRGMQQ